jgi:hypothetical protein
MIRAPLSQGNREYLYCTLEWKKRLSHGLSQVEESLKSDVPSGGVFDINCAGYVAQQYIQKTTRIGEKRAVIAYELLDVYQKQLKHILLKTFSRKKLI